MKKEKKICLNLGCGVHIVPSTKTEEWINMDPYPMTDKDRGIVQGDARRIPLESNSVDYILSDQVFEHLPMHDVPVAMHEIRRVLKPGGRAVIIVPDFRGSVEQWLKIDHDNNFNPFFYKYLSEVIYGGQLHEGDYHHTPFCPGFMNYVLHMAGFNKYRLVHHPAFSECPSYPGLINAPEAKCRNPQLVADITKES